MQRKLSENVPWWNPEHHAARRERLVSRGRIKSAIRYLMENLEFVEVEAAQLQVSPGNETHLHGFATTMRSTDGKTSEFYMHTSPEFACKKLLAAGETQIFDFARVFRNRERGALHSPEFTMLEWYRVGKTYETLMDDCAAILQCAAACTGKAQWSFRNRFIDPMREPERMTVADAFMRFAGIDLLASVDGAETDRNHLAAEAIRASIRVADDDTWSDIFSRVLLEKIEPFIGNGCATILMEYPIPEAALARRKPGSTKVAERFELYACGVELANAFGELTDPVEQLQRFQADMDLKQAIYGERYPIDEELLSALAFMPAASGAALGFDRLVMLATGASHIDEVIWTPVVDPFKDHV
jgi:elongation factor P--(R)-beta-lysine ligase